MRVARVQGSFRNERYKVISKAVLILGLQVATNKVEDNNDENLSERYGSARIGKIA